MHISDILDDGKRVVPPVKFNGQSNLPLPINLAPCKTMKVWFNLILGFVNIFNTTCHAYSKFPIYYP